MTPFFQLDPRIESASAAALQQVAPRFTEIDEITEYNLLKVLRAFMDNGISERHFGSSTGYGYGDEGRETLDKVWAQVFGAEDALVRHNFTCGTHTLAVALFGVLRPGDKMLCVSGMPYDTLHSVIGLTGENMGSLKDYGIAFDCVPLKEEHLDYEAIAKAVDDTVTMVYIQRSRGYELRASLSLEETQKVAEIAKEKNPNCIVMVDNCYCEFVNKQEPTQVGGRSDRRVADQKRRRRYGPHRRLHSRAPRFGRKVRLSTDHPRTWAGSGRHTGNESGAVYGSFLCASYRRRGAEIRCVYCGAVPVLWLRCDPQVGRTPAGHCAVSGT